MILENPRSFINKQKNLNLNLKQREEAGFLDPSEPLLFPYYFSILQSFLPLSHFPSSLRSGLDTIKDFLIKLGIKPRMHLLEIDIFLLYHVTVRPTKIMNRANKYWAHFWFSKNLFFKSLSPSLILFTEKKSERFCWFLMLKNDFASMNFAIFEEVVHNFGRSDNDMI